MTETRHTPGPWKIMQCLPAISEYEGQTETVIVDENGRNVLNRLSIFEEAANAKLMASAPELLEALRELFGFVEEWVLVMDTRDDAGHAWSLKAMRLVMTLQAAQQAIAKAEGPR